MSAYHTRASVAGSIPPDFLLEALDDDRDGIEDAGLYDVIAENASNEVDAFLGARIAVPMATPAPIAVQASRVFCLETLYARRGYSEKTDPPNPWAVQAKALRERLGRIASGEEPLEADRSEAPIVAVYEPSRTTSASGRLGT